MNGNFLFDDLLNLSLPRLRVNFSGSRGSIDAHTQGQRVLVLAGKWNQVLVAEHGTTILRAGRCPSKDFLLRVDRGQAPIARAIEKWAGRSSSPLSLLVWVCAPSRAFTNFFAPLKMEFRPQGFD